jgi:hypothetical protein
VRFHAAITLPAGRTALSALLYITGSPPIYSDPWNVTKILGGYKLALNGTVRGWDPGAPHAGRCARASTSRTSPCPARRTWPTPPVPGLCAPVQPVDGYDLSREVAAALSAGMPLLVDVASYGLVQPDFGLVPAVQAALHIRWYR